MLKNYLKITLRNLWKNKVFVIINVLGLGIAIACCIVAYLNYNFGQNFDSDMTSVDDIYRIDLRRESQDHSQLYGFTPIPLGAAADANISQLDEVMRYMPSGANYRVGEDVFSENLAYVDPNFFDLFPFDFIAGNASSLQETKSIIISDEIADKYFPDGSAMGEIFTRLSEDGPQDYTVTGIFRKKPINSSFGGVETVMNIRNYFSDSPELENDWENWITTFVRVSNAGDIPEIEQQLTSRYKEIQNNARIDFKVESYELEPFKGMGTRAEAGEVWGHWLWYPPPPPAILVPGIMAILILLIACFNFTNTSMAIAGKRLKEIGLRKVMGGLRQQLVMQFMLENFFLCFFALLVGLIISWFLVPAYSAMWEFIEISLDLTGNAGFYLFLLLILFATGLLAGSYPAFYVSKFEPATILRRNLKYGGTSIFTNILLGAQFTISLIAIMMGIIFYQNARYQESIDLGYDARGTISLYFNDPDDYQVFRNRVENNLDILSVAGSEHQIDRSYRNDPVKSEDKEFDVDIFHVGNGFFETIGYELTDGRMFRENSQTDMDESIIVSEEMVKTFEWDNPIGQKIVWMDTVQLYVIGVMKDVYTNGLWSPITPLMIRYVPEEKYEFMTVKYPANETVAINEFLRSEWKEVFPNENYTGQYLDEELAGAAEVNYNIQIMFGSLGVIAMFLSAMGLFSLVSLSILKRMKEIGVRKVLGASVPSIMTLIQKKYVIILLVACVFGSVLSYFAANGLMDSIWIYHITPGASAFLLAIVLIFLVAFSTVGVKVFRAATANPTETIRNE